MIPMIHPVILANSNASGIKSKQIIAVIKPAANSKTKLKILFEFTFKQAPITPPNVVPNMPKIKP